LTARSSERLLRAFNVFKLDVTEALWTAGLAICWKSHILHCSVFAKELPHRILGGVEAEVTDEKGCRWWAGLIAKRFSSVLSRLRFVHWPTSVNVDGPTVDLLAVESYRSFHCFRGCKVNMAKATRFSGVAVYLNVGRDDLTTFFELLGQLVVVNIPGKSSNKNALDFVLRIGRRCRSTVLEFRLFRLGNTVINSLSFAI
jgi:hypothetical protein